MSTNLNQLEQREEVTVTSSPNAPATPVNDINDENDRRYEAGDMRYAELIAYKAAKEGRVSFLARLDQAIGHDNLTPAHTLLNNMNAVACKHGVEYRDNTLIPVDVDLARLIGTGGGDDKRVRRTLKDKIKSQKLKLEYVTETELTDGSFDTSRLYVPVSTVKSVGDYGARQMNVRIPLMTVDVIGEIACKLGGTTADLLIHTYTKTRAIFNKEYEDEATLRGVLKQAEAERARVEQQEHSEYGCVALIEMKANHERERKHALMERALAIKFTAEKVKTEVRAEMAIRTIPHSESRGQAGSMAVMIVPGAPNNLAWVIARNASTKSLKRGYNSAIYTINSEICQIRKAFPNARLIYRNNRVNAPMILKAVFQDNMNCPINVVPPMIRPGYVMLEDPQAATKHSIAMRSRYMYSVPQYFTPTRINELLREQLTCGTSYDITTMMTYTVSEDTWAPMTEDDVSLCTMAPTDIPEGELDEEMTKYKAGLHTVNTTKIGIKRRLTSPQHNEYDVNPKQLRIGRTDSGAVESVALNEEAVERISKSKTVRYPTAR